MADFLAFNEGRKELTNNGLPTTCYFLLSTRDCTTLTVTDTLSGGIGEITGTGYARQSESEPTATSANPSAVAFSQKSWSTGSATDWPASVKSCVLVTTSDNTGKAICAWNLVAGGTARAMNAASTTENFTPTLNVAQPPMACLGAKTYDPTVAVTKATSALLQMTAVDTTNLRIAFTAPSNGQVLVRLVCNIHGAATYPQILLGAMSGATVMGRQAPVGAPTGTALATTFMPVEAVFVVTGLVASSAQTWDAAYGVETIVSSTGIKYGGPNNTTGNDAFGAFCFEIWNA